VTSKGEWLNFLRSSDALAFRKSASSVLKSGMVTATLNDLADYFPMKSSGLGLILEEKFDSADLEVLRNAPLKLSSSIAKNTEPYFLLSEAYEEEKISSSSLMGKTVWTFSDWKKKSGPKAMPFEFECEFLEDFPRITLRCPQKILSTEVTLSEALLITELSADQLEEVILRAAWIAAFARYQLKSASSNREKMIFRIRMGINSAFEPSPFVFLGLSMDLLEIESELKNYYLGTLWGKTVVEIQNQARERGMMEWKRYCTEPAPWLDPKLKAGFSQQYQKMILGITSCLSE